MINALGLQNGLLLTSTVHSGMERIPYSSGLLPGSCSAGGPVEVSRKDAVKRALTTASLFSAGCHQAIILAEILQGLAKSVNTLGR
jgi:hypothetical protein